MRSARAFAAFGVSILISTSGASAQDVVFTPVNPSFGGNPFNSTHLLEIANAQRPEEKREAFQEEAELTLSELFLQQLESRLLSAVAADVTEAIFGDNPADSGTVSFADQIVTFERTLDLVHLTVVDLSTGTTTEINIPILVTN